MKKPIFFILITTIFLFLGGATSFYKLNNRNSLLDEYVIGFKHSYIGYGHKKSGALLFSDDSIFVFEAKKRDDYKYYIGEIPSKNIKDAFNMVSLFSEKQEKERTYTFHYNDVILMASNKYKNKILKDNGEGYRIDAKKRNFLVNSLNDNIFKKLENFKIISEVGFCRSLKTKIENLKSTIIKETSGYWFESIAGWPNSCEINTKGAKQIKSHDVKN